MDQKKLDQQSQHWENEFSSKPEMFGLTPSLSAEKALKIFQDRKINKIIELGEGFYSHMLYCMALTTIDLKKLNSEIFRVLKPGGINIYTVRHTNDGDFQNGIYLGEDLYENDGFIVHYFSKEKVNSLLGGFKNITLDKFEEGKFPRRLFFVVNEKII